MRTVSVWLHAAKADPKAVGCARTWGCICGVLASPVLCPYHAGCRQYDLLRKTYAADFLKRRPLLSHVSRRSPVEGCSRGTGGDHLLHAGSSPLAQEWPPGFWRPRFSGRRGPSPRQDWHPNCHNRAAGPLGVGSHPCVHHGCSPGVADSGVQGSRSFGLEPRGAHQAQSHQQGFIRNCCANRRPHRQARRSRAGALGS
jgi:hypothetical protein